MRRTLRSWQDAGLTRGHLPQSRHPGFSPGHTTSGVADVVTLIAELGLITELGNIRVQMRALGMPYRETRRCCLGRTERRIQCHPRACPEDPSCGRGEAHVFALTARTAHLRSLRLRAGGARAGARSDA